MTIYINEGISPIFVFLFAQVYLNWYSIYTISGKTSTIVSESAMNGDHLSIRRNDQFGRNILQHSTREVKFWYCEKCRCYTCKPTQHCTFCKKCFHFRDHHCFFLGRCILQQNIGNFILICLYSSLACFYSLLVLGPYLYQHLSHFMNPTSNIFNVVLNFSFPVALCRLLLSKEDTCLILVTLFDALVSVCCMSLTYGIWKLYNCLTGKQRYYSQVPRKQGLKEIFGSYGLSNIIFPYNGLLGTRDLGRNYELKEV